MPYRNYNGTATDSIEDFIGETVTVFTTSGGESGSGFTGVLLAVTDYYIRLLIQIGPAPDCALGNACDIDRGCCGFFGRRRSGRRINDRINTVGSVADIPLDSIVSFVHNSI